MCISCFIFQDDKFLMLVENIYLCDTKPIFLINSHSFFFIKKFSFLTQNSFYLIAFHKNLANINLFDLAMKFLQTLMVN